MKLVSPLFPVTIHLQQLTVNGLANRMHRFTAHIHLFRPERSVSNNPIPRKLPAAALSFGKLQPNSDLDSGPGINNKKSVPQILRPPSVSVSDQSKSSSKPSEQGLSPNLSRIFNFSTPPPPLSKPTAKPSPSLSGPLPSSSSIPNVSQIRTTKPSESRNLSPYFSKQTVLSPKPSSSSPNPAPPTSKPDQTKTNCIQDEKGTSSSSSSSKQYPSLFWGPSSSSSKPPPPSTKPTLSLGPSNLSNDQAKSNYIQVDKESSPLYVIPEDIKGLIEKDIVPGVLKKSLSQSTYKDYFAALLYAEDYYFEKWNGFEMKNVTLELQDAAIYRRKGKYKNLNKFDKKDEKMFVAFEIDSIPERRPFLLSRDFAFVRPSGREVDPFKGIIYRVVKSNLVLVEFGDDFHSQHYSACKYDVNFSFNRVCLKRAHQAIAAASDPLFRNFLFPAGCVARNSCTASQLVSIDRNLDMEKASAVRQILSLQGPPPYLVDGPISIITRELSRTGMVVREAVLQIYRTFPKCRILICAPMNSTCDVLMMSLKEDIPESDMFRANAAFREFYEVPDDILPSCLYEGECFSCPSLQKLKKFKVIFSTFMSSFRLHNEGIMAGHFSHIFLVDASFAMEPETIVPLANLADERTPLVITGTTGNGPRWVRSKIARQNGLTTSYFERLRGSKLYCSPGSQVYNKIGRHGAKIGWHL
ncbi:hypothetical protein F0562_025443 [Nyssa sinensis]|uniref:Helicase MOV-10-like beta-barrel domain-containing protein n=1 Tax=Nyssa sinensis TaxID=561372 RepID=A0A5J5BGT7_9ASTE|nr:hypothetical protein F0562_025443 [Nyssa sinensis]